jgi:dTDP-4-amino-4,6-dideoxygalactose transaminase
MHLQPLYAGAPFYGDGTSEELFKEGICLPSSPAVSNDDLERVIGVFDSIRAAKR